MSKQPKLFLPSADGTGTKVEIAHNGSVVIVGANGSGKSRLGAWIEKNTGADVVVHRISAQRALDLPDYAVMKSLEQSTTFSGETNNPDTPIKRTNGDTVGVIVLKLLCSKTMEKFCLRYLQEVLIETSNTQRKLGNQGNFVGFLRRRLMY